MWNFLSAKSARQLSVFWSAVIIIGLFTSAWVRVLPSIGMAGLFLTGLGYSWGQRRVAQWARWPQLLSFLLVYLVHAGTGLLQNSPTNADLWQDLVLQLPFVLLPLSFWLLPTWPPAHKRLVWLLLIGSCVVAAAGATINYLLHYQAIAQLYIQSQVMPTEPDHIRFSLLISMAVLAGLVLLFSATLPPLLRGLVGAAVVLLFVFQHLLAVRSGIVTMYAGGMLWLGWLGWRQGRWQVAVAGVVLVLGLGAGCVFLFPTLQNRLDNTRFDATQMNSAEAANNFSVTARVYSYQVAWLLVQQHPLLGVSKPQLTAAMASQYGYLFPQINPAKYVLPHNQYLYNLAAYGAIGLLLFLLGFYYCLWVGIRERNILLLLMYLIVSLSFLVEYTLESNIGVVVGLFFLLLAAVPEREAVSQPEVSSPLS